MFDFITYSFPAPFPIFFNLAYSFCLVRLSRQDIIGTQADKTVEGSRLKTLCFDKTGTLTLNRMEMVRVYACSGECFQEVSGRLDDHLLIQDLFASCNSVEVIQGELKGDEIDLRMFEGVKASLDPTGDRQVMREVRVGDRRL